MNYLSNCLVSLGLWIARLGGWSDMSLSLSTHAPTVTREIFSRIKSVIAETDTSIQMVGSGETKRHMTFMKLIREYPEIPKCEMSLAIELAIIEGGK